MPCVVDSPLACDVDAVQQDDLRQRLRRIAVDHNKAGASAGRHLIAGAGFWQPDRVQGHLVGQQLRIVDQFLPGRLPVAVELIGQQPEHVGAEHRHRVRRAPSAARAPAGRGRWVERQRTGLYRGQGLPSELRAVDLGVHTRNRFPIEERREHIGIRRHAAHRNRAGDEALPAALGRQVDTAHDVVARQQVALGVRQGVHGWCACRAAPRLGEQQEPGANEGERASRGVAADGESGGHGHSLEGAGPTASNRRDRRVIERAPSGIKRRGGTMPTLYR